MHDAPKDMSSYKDDLSAALDNTFLRQALDKFAVAYKGNRENIFRGLDDRALIADIAASKRASTKRLDELYEQFKTEAEKRGVFVHRVATAADANELIARIAAENGVKMVVKSKSMTAEETQLNTRLEKDGLEVVESDLGEWIIQLRHEGPSHMVMPAIHLSKEQVADDFSKEVGKHLDNDITKLVRVARRSLRRKFIECGMGVSGVNFAVAETGAIATVTNEGNARMVTTLPKVHVALAGLDKLTPTIDEALKALMVLPRNATAQMLTSYVNWISGATESKNTESGRKIMHVIFLDNGRSALAKDPVFSDVLNCVRCGACANVCPVYRMVGGHKMGYIYIGAIGLILTYFFHGRDKAKVLVQNCINCEACKDICAGGIDLPKMIMEIRARLNEEEGTPIEATLLGAAMRNRKVFHSLLKFAKFAQRPVTGGTPYIRHLPQMFLGDHGFRALPALAGESFRDKWEAVKPKIDSPRYRVAIFSGCAGDFIYPEQLEAGVKLLASQGVDVEFPMDQTCCGLPLETMGQRKVSKEVAMQNVKAFDPARYEAIITLCASCASHLKHKYGHLLEDKRGEIQRVRAFTDKITDFSSFVRDTLGLGADSFVNNGEKVAYHAACHLCRGLDVHAAPRDLIAASAEYVQSAEEEVCCGFGGSYSVKFPKVSANILAKKLENVSASGAERLVADCPGCVMQLRGGAEKKGLKLKVTHISELLNDHLKK